MLEELKYALLNFSEQEIHIHFKQSKNGIEFVHYNVVLEGIENVISVFCDPAVRTALPEPKYLNKANTEEKFQSVSAAINYLKYMAKVVTDFRYEQYHYFIFKLKEINLDFKRLHFMISSGNEAIRCDMGELVLDGKPLKYNFIFIATKNEFCELVFYPENPLWDEGKICPVKDVEDIIKYILNIKTDDYDGIPLKET
jgi:hypothetical protein